MMKIDLGQTITILANIGVIAGIVFLGIELNQSNRLAQAQTRDSIAQSLAALLHADSLSAEARAINERAIAGEELGPIEQAQWVLNWSAYFRLWENMHYQYRIGLFSDSEILAEQRSWERILSNSALRDLWCSRRHEHSVEFRMTIDGLIGESGCE